MIDNQGWFWEGCYVFHRGCDEKREVFFVTLFCNRLIVSVMKLEGSKTFLWGLKEGSGAGFVFYSYL